MHIENLKKWLKGEYVCSPDFKESLKNVIRDNEKDYKQMSKSLIGETIQNFFCNGFFGSRTYDLDGAEITRVYQNNHDVIVIEVKKLNGKYDYGYFEDEWEDWKCVYEHLDEWIKGEQNK